MTISSVNATEDNSSFIDDNIVSYDNIDNVHINEFSQNTTDNTITNVDKINNDNSKKNIEKQEKINKVVENNYLYANSKGTGDGSSQDNPTTISTAIRAVKDNGTIVLVTDEDSDSDEYLLTRYVEINHFIIPEEVYSFTIQAQENKNITFNAQDLANVFNIQNITVTLNDINLLNAKNNAVTATAANVTLNNVFINNSGTHDVYAYQNSNVTINNSKLLNSRGYGIYINQAQLTITNNIIDNTVNESVYIRRANVTLENNTISNSKTNGLYIYQYVNITLKNNTLKNFGNTSITIYQVYNITLINNTISNSSNYLIYILSANTTFINNTIANASNYTIYVTSNSNVTLNGNYITGLYVNRATATLTNNKFENPKIHAIYLYTNTNATLINNTITNINNGSGIYLDYYVKAEISGNNISNIKNSSIYLRRSNATIINNTITNVSVAAINDTAESLATNYIIITNNTLSNVFRGLYLTYSTNATITNNIINNTNNSAIYLYRNSVANIQNNTILNSKSTGIYTEYYINLNITNNTIINHTSYAIVIQGHSESNITNNTISNTGSHGIYIDSSSEVNINQNIISNSSRFAVSTQRTSTSKLTNNTLEYNNGAINSDNTSTVTVTENIIRNNTATSGVINNSGIITLENNNILDNTGNIIINNTGTITVKNNLFVNNTNGNDILIQNNNVATVEDNIYINNLLNNTIEYVLSDEYNLDINVILSPIYNDKVQNGTISVLINNETVYTGDLINQKQQTTIDTTKLTQVENIIEIKYNTLDNHYQNTSQKFSIYKKEYNVDYSVISNLLDNTQISIIVLDEEDNAITNIPVTIILPNQTTLTENTNSEGIVNFNPELTGGENTIIIDINGNEIYGNYQKEIIVTVEKLNTIISASILDNTVNNVILNVEINDAEGNPSQIDGEINVFINDDNIGQTVLPNNNINLNIENKGTYDLIIKYSGNDKYNENELLLENIQIKGITPTITATVIDNTFENTIIRVIVNDLENNPITTGILIVNDDTIEITDESTDIKLDLPLGENTVNIEYQENDKYEYAQNTISVTVNTLQTLITVSPVEVYNNQIAHITATLTTNTDLTVNSGKVVFKINGKTLKDDNGKIIYATVQEGQASIDYNITNIKDNSIIQAVYSGNAYFTKATSENETISIKPTKVILNTTDLTVHEQDQITIQTTIEGITNGKIVYKLNGKTLKDDNGKVIYSEIIDGKVTLSYQLPKTLKANEYTLTTIYTYNSERIETNSTITIKK